MTTHNAAPPPPRGSSPPHRLYPRAGPASACLPLLLRWQPRRGLPFRRRPNPACAAFLKRPASLPARAALLTASLAAVTFFLLSYSPRGVGFGPYHIDLDVYRIGGRVWLRGGNLYGRLPATRAGVGLPFTYPPVAAVLLSPFSLVPMTVAATALTLGTITLLAVVLRMFLRRLAGPAAGSRWALAWLLPPALFLEPMRDTLGFGQVNVVLMALVSLDCLAEAPHWPRGALTGLAAAVKLTPAAFVLFFLVRRDRRAACTAAVSFAAVTAIGFAVAWHDSVRYWTGIVFQANRAGDPVYASNQSILAILARAGLDPRPPAGMAIWLALSAVAAAVACRGMRHAFSASADCLALSLNAFAALLISPVSWSHHWVWCVPALLALTALGVAHHSRLPLAAAATGLVVFAAAPQLWFPHGQHAELRWAAWQQATGSSYALFAALALVLASSAAIFPPGGSPGMAAGPQQPGQPLPGNGQDTPISGRTSPTGPSTASRSFGPPPFAAEPDSTRPRLEGGSARTSSTVRQASTDQGRGIHASRGVCIFMEGIRARERPDLPHRARAWSAEILPPRPRCSPAASAGTSASATSRRVAPRGSRRKGDHAE